MEEIFKKKMPYNLKGFVLVKRDFIIKTTNKNLFRILLPRKTSPDIALLQKIMDHSASPSAWPFFKKTGSDCFKKFHFQNQHTFS